MNSEINKLKIKEYYNEEELISGGYSKYSPSEYIGTSEIFGVLQVTYVNTDFKSEFIGDAYLTEFFEYNDTIYHYRDGKLVGKGEKAYKRLASLLMASATLASGINYIKQ